MKPPNKFEMCGVGVGKKLMPKKEDDWSIDLAWQPIVDAAPQAAPAQSTRLDSNIAQLQTKARRLVQEDALHIRFLETQYAKVRAISQQPDCPPMVSKS